MLSSIITFGLGLASTSKKLASALALTSKARCTLDGRLARTHGPGARPGRLARVPGHDFW